MAGRLRLAGVGLVTILFAAACTGGGLRQIDTAEPGVAAEPATLPTQGEAYVGIPAPMFIFGPPLQNPIITTSTLAIRAMIQPHARLKVTPLASTPSTVAIGLQETASSDDVWGEIMIPQERRVFARFAADKSLGDWLIMVTDVRVESGPDGVPLTAYRWDRTAVERYAQCGIQPYEVPYRLNRCTEQFYLAPEILFLRAGNGISAGQ